MARKSKASSTVEGPSEYRPPDRYSVSVKKISNGYVINESGSKGGKYFDRDTFSKAKPKIHMPKMGGGRGGKGGLSGDTPI